MQNAPREHSAILSTFIKLLFVIKTFVLSIFEWLLKTGFTVFLFLECEWLNVSTPVSFSDQLKGKIVVLDFFTYCCINCIHVLPDLEALEQAYSITDGVVVIGVHSAKFDNEKVSANILTAVLRHNIHHPVVNDSGAILWNQLQIACWPTFVIVSPSGQFLYTIMGEGHRQRLLQFVGVAVDYYKEKGEISRHSLPLEVVQLPPSVLNFPGKVCVSQDGKTIVVADTGHHRILVLDKNGLVKVSC